MLHRDETFFLILCQEDAEKNICGVLSSYSTWLCKVKKAIIHRGKLKAQRITPQHSTLF